MKKRIASLLLIALLLVAMLPVTGAGRRQRDHRL